MLLSIILKAVLAVLALLPEDVNGGEANAGAVCGVAANVGSERTKLYVFACVHARASESVCRYVWLSIRFFSFVCA